MQKGPKGAQIQNFRVRFVLAQRTELDFYSASSLKQQSVGRLVAPLEHIIPITSLEPNRLKSAISI
jgi:hypothetical protein